MSKEEFNEPSPEELKDFMDRMEADEKKPDKEMDDFMDSMEKSIKNPDESEPTAERVDSVMTDIAAQFGEKYESAASGASQNEVVKEYEDNGWKLAEVVTNAAKVSVEAEQGKQIKIVGLGNRFLVFEKELPEDQ